MALLLYTVSVVTTAVLGSLAALAIYNITLHPLAILPGPKLCAFSRIPYWYHYVVGREVEWMHDLHKRYGAVVRFGPMDVSYADGRAWKDIAGYEKGRKENPKPSAFHVENPNGVASIINASQEDHTRVRKLFAPAFSDRALKQQEPLFKKSVNNLLALVERLSADSGAIEITRLYNFTTFDIMAELCFGKPLDLLVNNEYSEWVASVFGLLSMLPIVSIIQYYPVLKWLFSVFEPKWAKEHRDKHAKHTADRVNDRIRLGSENSDILNMVMEARGSEKGLSLEEMHSNAELFMLAGSETTGTVLAGLTYNLLRNPSAFDRLKSELRTTLETVGNISFEKTANLPYYNACIKESMRVYPALPTGLPRELPKGGNVILGQHLPEHTRVSVHQYSTFHSPHNFTDPDAFVPERWLNDRKYANDARDWVMPFSLGPRNCLGQQMAMHEMRLIFAALVMRFDLELDQEENAKHGEWMDQRTFAIWAKKPLYVRATPVKDLEDHPSTRL
ncbi:cytochrome P450 [Microdochium trichocladiopsis]|uniref:Cytochrome P450 n=1 Tax=Microdochium trichocladiopsis TaxID=1682393 RepID=A0A9P8XY94_9PEZI|nr:cytochrome P450 [Microdochium trichocladiopsis]KAH7020724.1 cytochrome P450 [Microdochium trichocladiopsis]